MVCIRKKSHRSGDLTQSELGEIFRAAAMQSPAAVCIVERSGASVFQNAAHTRFLEQEEGMAADEKYNVFRDPIMHLSGLFGTEAEAFADAGAREALVDYDPSQIPGSAARAPGRRARRVTVFPVKDGDGCVQHLMISHEDWTQKRTAERSLQRSYALQRDLVQAYQDSERRFRIRYEAVEAGIFVIGADGVVRFVNRAASEILGQAAEHLMGQSFSEHLWSPVKEDGSPYALEELPEVETLRTGEPRRNVFVGIVNRRTGAQRATLHNTEPLIDPETGAVEEVVSTFLDVTDRKQAQEALAEAESKYRDLVEKSLFGVYVIQDGRFVYVNSQFAEMYGAPVEELIGLTPEDLSVPEDHAMIREYVRQRLAGEIKSVRYTLRGLRRNGEVIHVEVMGSITVYHGRPAIIGSALDITDRLRAEEEIRIHHEWERRLEIEAEESKREFYRWTILSVTEGKLNLVDRDEIERVRTPGAASVALLDPKALPALRDAVQRTAEGAGMPHERIFELVSAVVESATNALKHGAGGIASIGLRNGRVQVCIEDQGPGIDSMILPRAALHRGFSTKPSMGLGFSIILSMVDTVYLDTGKSGTTIVLEKEVREQPPEVRLDQWPDL